MQIIISSAALQSSLRIHSALRVQKQLTTNRPQSLEAQRKELNMALVLICIVVLFILCQSVKIVPDVYEALVCRRQQVVRCSHGLPSPYVPIILKLPQVYLRSKR